MEITKQLLIDAIIGRGLVGTAKNKLQERHLFIQLDLCWDTATDEQPLRVTWNRRKLSNLPIDDLELIYNRQYESDFKRDFILPNSVIKRP